MAALSLVTQPGGTVWVAEAPDWWKFGKDHLQIGISQQALSAKAGRGQLWHLGQMYGVLGTGLIFAEHAFEGLNRDMYVSNNKSADKDKLAVTWAAKNDAQFIPSSSYVEFCPAPNGCVFAVYISVNQMLNEFPDIDGWAEHWTWLDADPDKAGAPIDWSERYDTLLWSSS